MVDIAAIAGLATSLRSIVEITKAMKDVHDANLIQTKVFELTREIMSAQADALAAMQAQSALLAEKRELESQITKLETWNTEKQRYQFKTIQTGVHVYALKEGMDGGEDPHYICPNCYNRAQKSVLQREIRAPGQMVVHACHDCGSEFIEQGMRQPGQTKAITRKR